MFNAGTPSFQELEFTYLLHMQRPDNLLNIFVLSCQGGKSLGCKIHETEYSGNQSLEKHIADNTIKLGITRLYKIYCYDPGLLFLILFSVGYLTFTYDI